MGIILLAPPNSGGLSTGGKSYTPDANSEIEVPTDCLAEALAHGFTVPPTIGDVDLQALTKADLVQFAADNLSLALSPSLTKSDLIGQIEAAMAAGGQ